MYDSKGLYVVIFIMLTTWVNAMSTSRHRIDDYSVVE